MCRRWAKRYAYPGFHASTTHGRLTTPPIYGPPTRQPEGLPGGASLIPQFASPLSISNCGYLKGLSREPGASRCIACSSVGATVREWPRQARRLAAGPGGTLEIPPDGRGEAVKALRGFQLQIRTLTERLYQLGTGEEESFRHARQGVPYPGQGGGSKKGEAVGGRIQPTRPNPLPLPVTG